MPPSDFAKAPISQVVNDLTTEEAILLTAGVGFWHTRAIGRLGIPAVKTSDGPNGVRGNHFFMGTPAKCLPSATALGATFNPKLIHSAGLHLIGPEAKLRAASILLGPTVNMQRNPLGGRSFESFSEDPFLSGTIAAAYVAGVQENGIGCTIKHFACNDKEDDRMGYDCIMSDRALREIYLMPFMIAQRDAKPWAFMTAYNRINGTHCSENPLIIDQILRKEWGFDGMTMSDWFGIYSIDHSVNAGLDLEMPGTNKWRTIDLMTRSIQSRKITSRVIKDRARRVLELVQRCCKECPEILDGDGIERTAPAEPDSPANILMRQVAAEGVVLLKNDVSLLPLKLDQIKKLAIIGPNAKARVLSGGGSAALKAEWFVSPYEGLTKALREWKGEVLFAEGTRATKQLPHISNTLLPKGWNSQWFAHTSDESLTTLSEPFTAERWIDETRIFISTSYPEGITRRWTMKLKGELEPVEKDTLWEFGIVVAGRAKLFIDGEVVVDAWTRQERGTAFFGSGSLEKRGTYMLKANTKHQIYVEFCNVRAPADGDKDEAVLDANAGVQIGAADVRDSDDLMHEAVELAAQSDVVVTIVGLNEDWESEGYDRTTLALPARTNELVGKVTTANPNTVVVTQSGSAITMPWADNVSTMVHAWYLGNSTGDAIADVLLGKVNPSGKLSLTFPRKEQDMPSFSAFHSENGKLRYAEDLHVGYRWYPLKQIKPLFAFGHGLSYTTFSLSNLRLSEPKIEGSSFQLTATVSLTNTGALAGSEVIQVYMSLPNTVDVTHPMIQLKSFSKAEVQPGETKEVELCLDKYAVSYWEDRFNCWRVENGEYVVSVGTASDNLPLKGTFVIHTPFEWSGL